MASADLATQSPRSTLSKFKRSQENSNNNSTTSLASSSASDNADGDQLLRVAADGPLEKLKQRIRRKSVDDRRGSDDSNRRLSTFIAGRRNKVGKTTSNDGDGSNFVDSTNPNLQLSGNKSESSLVREVEVEAEDESGHSSLLTDDNNSDLDGKPLRPTISAHPSHAGYLTLSSPEVQSQTQPVTTGSEIEPSPSSTPAFPPTSNVPQIIEPSDVEPPVTRSPERSPSPAQKFAKAFSLPRKKSGPDSESVKSATNGQGGLSGLFRPSSRGSVASREAEEPKKEESAIPAEAETIQEPAEKFQPRPETPKARGRPTVSVEALPSTPPNNITDTPTTFVTPPTPTFANVDSATFPITSPKKSPASTRSDSIKHRRSQSANLPSSKLSQSIPAPLTPTAEETKTPGGTLAHPANATGFFSSVFSATQKAVDSLSSTINTSIGPNQKSRSVTSQPGADGGEEVIPGSQSQSTVIGENGEKKELAVDTLGSGDLTLGHLGISEAQAMNSSADLALQNGSPPRDEANKKAEQDAANRAISEAYEKPVANVVKEATGGGRPLSIASTDRLTLGPGDQTPPRPGVDGDAIKRSNSTRSKLSRRRHRGSSATTGTGAGNSVMAGLAASGAGFGNLQANGTGHRLTGFAVASNKRNKDFHSLFRSVPEDDYLIEDYSAALSRDILLHGRLYVSEGHICFSSNILGWVTNLVISFDEVVSVEKKSTAVIFPNAIVISTLHARNTFASFVARDSTYELLIGIWKISHPNLKSSLNGVTLDNAGTGDKTEVADPEGSEGSEGSDSDDEVYDEDADDDTGSFEDAALAPSIAGSDAGADNSLSRKTSAQPLAPSVAQANGFASKGPDSSETAAAAVVGGTDVPGPATHEPTQCTDSAEHYDRPLTDTTIPAPLGKVYSLMFGPASAAFMKKWLVEDQKSRDLNLADSTTGLDNDHKSMTFDYIKPLNAPVGPKQTKCITTNTLMTFDLEKVVTVDCSTQTPDVPSGNVFTTKTRYCLMWGPGNSTRMIANCTIEWTGKSWLKGPIEKGANDGQIEYVKSLVAALKAAVTSKAVAKGPGKKGKRKGKKEPSDADDGPAKRDAAAAAEQQAADWGLLEPIHGLLKPFISLLSPFITSQTIIAVLFVLLLYTWVSPPGPRGSSVGYAGYTSPERLAAYGEMWRREESSLWDWLEDRVGVDDIYAPGVENDRQKVVAAKKMGKKVVDERMTERQVDSAIKVTEQRLEALKEAVARNKGKRGVKG